MKKTRAAKITRKNTRFRTNRGSLRGGASDDDDDDDDEYFNYTFLDRMFRAIDQSNGSRSLEALLVKHKSKINEVSEPVYAYGESFFESLLHRAVTQIKYKADDLKKVSILLDVKGIDVNIYDSDGRTPLMVTRSAECVKLLLAHPGIKVNAVDQEGRTALWHAAALNSKAEDFEERYNGKEYNAKDALEISILLLFAGADETIADDYGITVVKAAEDVGFGSLLDVLSTRAKHSDNIENFKSFVTEMKYTPVDEHNPKKISFFYEDYKKLQKKYTRKKLESFYLRASRRGGRKHK